MTDGTDFTNLRHPCFISPNLLKYKDAEPSIKVSGNTGDTGFARRHARDPVRAIVIL